ncbi:MAG: tripartite tricarboxylate transporter permease [Gemmatimonadales bacterium]
MTALIMLAGVYHGAQHGRSTTAILINLPGEAFSAVTTIDGYRMAQQGAPAWRRLVAGGRSKWSG